LKGLILSSRLILIFFEINSVLGRTACIAPVKH
jgi:hypothetical protein